MVDGEERYSGGEEVGEVGCKHSGWRWGRRTAPWRASQQRRGQERRRRSSSRAGGQGGPGATDGGVAGVWSLSRHGGRGGVGAGVTGPLRAPPCAKRRAWQARWQPAGVAAVAACGRCCRGRDAGGGGAERRVRRVAGSRVAYPHVSTATPPPPYTRDLTRHLRCAVLYIPNESAIPSAEAAETRAGACCHTPPD